jgi:hypothetical protein
MTRRHLSPAEKAAEFILDVFGFEDMSYDLFNRKGGLCVISECDTQLLANLTGLEPLTWTAYDGSALPWAITEEIVRALAVRHPGALLQAIHLDEAKARWRAMHGEVSKGGRRQPDRTLSAGVCQTVDLEYVPMRAVVRTWCGAAAANYDELAAARAEVVRITAIAESAINRMRHTGRKDCAHCGLLRDLEETPSDFGVEPFTDRDFGMTPEQVNEMKFEAMHLTPEGRLLMTQADLDKIKVEVTGPLIGDRRVVDDLRWRH